MMVQAPIMLLLDTDMVMEPERIRAAVADIQDKGFDSICIEFRNCMYNGFDRAGYDAFAIAALEAAARGLKVVQILSGPGRDWLKRYPEHRRKLLVEYRGQVLDGKFRLLADSDKLGGIRAKFAGIEKVFLVNREAGGSRIVQATDITSEFEYVSEMNAVPELSGKYGEDGEILLYARYHDDEVDWASPFIMDTFEAQAALYEGLPISGYAMDEFGTGTHAPGVYHAGRGFLGSFRERWGYDLLDKLYLLQNEAVGESAGKVRFDYYKLTMEHTYAIQSGVKERFAARYGQGLFAGFHHTWWGEGNSGDLWAGNMDYFRLADNLSGGFVDAQYDAERTMTSMTMLAESIAKYSETGVAYNMCWDRNPTPEKMDYYHRLLSVRGVHWVAHTYGRSGEFGPGYPDHRTWGDVSACTSRESIFQFFIGAARSRPKIALLYVWESTAYVSDSFMHYHRMSMKALLDKLLDRHIEVDVIPTFETDLRKYEAVLVLWPTMLPEATWQALRSFADSGGKLVFMGPPAQCTVEGRELSGEFESLIGASIVARGEGVSPSYPGEHEYIAWDMWFTDQKIDMRCYPLKPVDGIATVLQGDDVLGVRKGNVDYYAFEVALTPYCDPLLDSLLIYRELALSDCVRSKVSYEGDELAVITLTGRWDSLVEESFMFRGSEVTVRGGVLVGLKWKGDVVVGIVGEYGEVVVNGVKYNWKR